MIISWNVNKNASVAKYAINKYLPMPIKNQLEPNDNLLILHEVPKADFNDLKNDSNYKDYLDIESPENKKNGRPDAVTIAVFYKGKYEVDETYKQCLLDIFESYNNRVIAVHKVGKYSETFVGVHCPENGIASGGTTVINFWDGLEKFHMSMKKWDKALIYLGDFNTYNPNTLNKRRMYRFMSYGLVDFWLEKGESHNKATYNANTRIDYALVTDKDYSALAKKYDMEVNPDNIMEMIGPQLSDHSAIILKEKTPETKKTGELK